MSRLFTYAIIVNVATGMLNLGAVIFSDAGTANLVIGLMNLGLAVLLFAVRLR